MKIKRIFKPLFLIALIIGLYISGIAIAAYFDWQKNRERLISNLFEYHERIKNYTQRDKYIILDDEGKIIEIKPTVIYDRNKKVIGKFSPTKREITRFSGIPKNFIRSIIKIEDSAFYTHEGINYRGILRAALKNLIRLKIVEGGSTITQQLAKILFTSRRRNLYRKFLELYGAMTIEKNFSKDDILLMYLNTIYFGHGAYGIQSAAKLYFNKNIRNLDHFEISLLICLIPSPNNISPYNNIELAKKKQLIVLNRLKKFDLVSEKDFKKRHKRFWNKFQDRMDLSTISYWKMDINNAPYPVEYIRQYLSQRFTVSEILRGSLKVDTSIDMDIQNIIQSGLKEHLVELRSIYTNKDDYNNLQAAVIMSDPETGNILGFIGGKNFSFKNQLNRAFKIKRQVGSSIKPFLYAVGIDKRMFTLITVLTDKRVKFKDKNRYYKPKNYDLKYRGEMFFRNGLIKSVNTVSVQILNYLTPDLFIDEYLKRIYKGLGFEQKFLPVLSLALGTIEMSPYELSVAYSILANGGEKVFPILVKTVNNGYGKVLVENISIQSNIRNTWLEQNSQRILSSGTAYIISDTLKKVFSREGTAWYAVKNNPLKINLCGKTGTTSHFKDAWCIGYTKDYVAVVWIGFDDYDKSLGPGMTGGRLASPLVLKIFNKIYWNKPYQDFSIPSDEIIFCDIDMDTQKLATSGSTNILFKVPFLYKTEPKSY